MTMIDQGRIREAVGKPWTAADAEALYRVNAWGEGYFSVSDTGHVVIQPDGGPGRTIDLHEVVQGLRERGLQAPVLIRISDIFVHRFRRLHQAFAQAIEENAFGGSYIPAFPIKVNQQRPVVEEVHRLGASLGIGLEVGSKPELLAVLAITEASDDLILCNGFKDDGYLEAVVLATKLGRRILPIIESLAELDVLLRHAAVHNVRPRMGVRIKLASQGAGRWRESAGARSKFGLFASEVLELVRRLRAEGLEDCLELVHCHAGSQLCEIRPVKDSVAELAHVYAELVACGMGVTYIDVGGGLAVDYDGSRSSGSSSASYSLEEYAREVVYRIASVCNERGVPHPTIVSESGRAMAAYQSILVFNVLGRTELDRFRSTEDVPSVGEVNGCPQPIRDLMSACESVDENRLLEGYHDAVEAREQALQLFNAGFLSLEHRGLAERLYWSTCARIDEMCAGRDDVPEDLQDLQTILSDTYFCNLSIFQSVPDSWAIGQTFPIMPIHRLAERPARNAVLADLTCDSDGRIASFVGPDGPCPTLPVHELRADEEYHLAAFLVGAYQETLGDLHNLFGDTHVVHIRLHEDGGWWIDEVVQGDTAREVLSLVQFDAAALQARLARDTERAVRNGRMTLAESRALLRFYEAELAGYTYLEPEHEV